MSNSDKLPSNVLKAAIDEVCLGYNLRVKNLQKSMSKNLKTNNLELSIVLESISGKGAISKYAENRNSIFHWGDTQLKLLSTNTMVGSKLYFSGVRDEKDMPPTKGKILQLGFRASDSHLILSDATSTKAYKLIDRERFNELTKECDLLETPRFNDLIAGTLVVGYNPSVSEQALVGTITHVSTNDSKVIVAYSNNLEGKHLKKEAIEFNIGDIFLLKTFNSFQTETNTEEHIMKNTKKAVKKEVQATVKHLNVADTKFKPTAILELNLGKRWDSVETPIFVKGTRGDEEVLVNYASLTSKNVMKLDEDNLLEVNKANLKGAKELYIVSKKEAKELAVDDTIFIANAEKKNPYTFKAELVSIKDKNSLFIYYVNNKALAEAWEMRAGYISLLDNPDFELNGEVLLAYKDEGALRSKADDVEELLGAKKVSSKKLKEALEDELEEDEDELEEDEDELEEDEDELEEEDEEEDEDELEEDEDELEEDEDELEEDEEDEDEEDLASMTLSELRKLAVSRKVVKKSKAETLKKAALIKFLS